MLKNIELTAVMGAAFISISTWRFRTVCLHAVTDTGRWRTKRTSFSCAGFSWWYGLTLSYIPIAHMVWGGGLLASHGALDFAVAPGKALITAPPVGAYLIEKRGFR